MSEHGPKVIMIDKLLYFSKLLQSEESCPFSLQALWDEYFPIISSVFDVYRTDVEIKCNHQLFSECFECLSLVLKPYTIDSNEMYFIGHSSINHFVDELLPKMIRVVSILLDGGEETFGVKSISNLFFMIINFSLASYRVIRLACFIKLSPLISKMLNLGLSAVFENELVGNFLEVCRSFSFVKSLDVKMTLLGIIIPYVKPWIAKYSDKILFLHWTNILKNVTLDIDNTDADIALSIQAFPLFHCVLDVIKDEAFKDITFDDDAIVRSIMFFSNLSCVQSQVYEVFHHVKDFLDDWFVLVKQQDDENMGIESWSQLISIFSNDPSIIPHISPKYDDAMKWCCKNGGWESDYLKYIGNCYPSLQQWVDLSKKIKKCSSVQLKNRLYWEQREAILKFMTCHSTDSLIRRHREELLMCGECLRLFSCHYYYEQRIYLLIPALEDFIHTFFGYLARLGNVLTPGFDESYFWICSNCTYIFRGEKDLFFPMICDSVERVLQGGPKQSIRPQVLPYLLRTLRNISIDSSHTTKSSIIALIKPYFRDWLHHYDSEKCTEEWMVLLANITWDNMNSSPIPSICSETWCLCADVLKFIKKKFRGMAMFHGLNHFVLWFLANLSSFHAYSIEIFRNITDLLPDWFSIAIEKKHQWGMVYCVRLIAMLSEVPSLIPHLTSLYANMQSYQSFMKIWKDKFVGKKDIDTYFKNCVFSQVSDWELLRLLHSAPLISIMPYLEITEIKSLFSDSEEYIVDGMTKCGHNCSLHIFHLIKFYTSSMISKGLETTHTQTKYIIDIIENSLSKCTDIEILLRDSSFLEPHKEEEEKQSDEKSSNSSIDNSGCFLPWYSCLRHVHYIPLQHFVVRMPHSMERSTRQFMYDFIELTGAGVEALFDERTCSFEGFDQDFGRYTSMESLDPCFEDYIL
eukprot:gnl/Carplike_NY0171/1327_a1799_546.p1 GENE.gnl/Carplike_NY0171/1327_a1799_546~~gnl/Carplike_NY0171/1327_a1799_546.p1  ORF type:complete len:916 (+),score=142.91 gnl/Carplike_NY0171/1327_a1799_546:33-2780(+)